jgi:hypothetical protein
MLLRVSHLNVDHSLHQLATTMGNLAMAYERRGQCDESVSLLQESLSLYESMNNPKIQDTVNIVSLNIERLENDNDDNNNIELDLRSPPGVERVQSRAKVDQSHRSVVTPDNKDGPPNSRSKAHRSYEMFGSSNRGKAQSMTDESDNHDFLLLGSLSPLLTPMKQVRETVLAWFGTDRSFASLVNSSSTASSRKNDLHLAEIHLQPWSIWSAMTLRLLWTCFGVHCWTNDRDTETSTTWSAIRCTILAWCTCLPSSTPTLTLALSMQSLYGQRLSDPTIRMLRLPR